MIWIELPYSDTFGLSCFTLSEKMVILTELKAHYFEFHAVGKKPQL